MYDALAIFLVAAFVIVVPFIEQRFDSGDGQ